MRIAFVSYEFPPETAPGGIGTYTLLVANLLSGAGFSVHVFAGSNSKSSILGNDNLVIHRVFCKDPHDFQHLVVEVFSKEHEREPFDLLESAEIHGNALRIKEKYTGLPLHVRLHAGNHLVESLKKKYIPFTGKLRFFLGAARRGKFDLGYWRRYDFKNDPDYQFVKMAEFITAPSRQMKAWTVHNWQILPGKIKILENPFSGAAGLEKARTTNQEQVILFYGRINVLKGLVTATGAMKQILADNPGWEWLVIGDDGFAPNGQGSMKAWMKKVLAPVLSQVEFYDRVTYSDLPAYLRKASIVIVPSLFESFSYVTLEAMYAGKAVVGSRDTGIENLIEDGSNGLLADPLSKRSWIRAIQQLINHPSKREKMGKAAVHFAERRAGAYGEIVNYYRALLPQMIH